MTIEANKKVIDFLDVTLDLNTGKHKPYNKPNNIPEYVHKDSNHSPCTIKNIPINISLSELSSDHHIFEQAKCVYQNVLIKSGYNHQLTYTPPTENTKHQKGRRRNITWYNPPFDLNVATNVGQDLKKMLSPPAPTL